MERSLVVGLPAISTPSTPHKAHFEIFIFFIYIILGWVPSQFKSSRADKGDRGGQKPEDFMDDEDRGAFGFAAEALKTKSGFQGGEGGSGSSVLGSASGAFLEQLVKPVQGTVGERLLQAQGWKPGQGIGPKLTRQARNKRRGKGDEGKEKDDPMLEKYKDFLFAPDETPIAVAKPKDNFFGIGYSGLARGTGAPLVHGSSDYKVSFGGGGKKGMKKFSITGEAFGIGADEEDDDMSVYNQGGLAEYDFSLDVSGKEERREKRSKEQSRWGAPTSADMSANFLEGFKLARSQSLLKKRYAPPQIPHDWTPKGRPSKRRSRWDSSGDQDVARPQGVPLSQSRGGTNPSVEQRRSVLFPDQANKEVKVEDPIVPIKLPDFLKGEIKSDGSFKPFARNPEKQKRYDQYRICLENNNPEVLRSLQPRSMTEWEREKEKLEFERASMLFQPMKGVIGSRFVSAGDSVTVDEGGGTGEVVKKDGGVEAASIGMFGALTRIKEEWHPARLLCVRFNVAHPYSDTSTTGTTKPSKRDTGVTNVFAALENVQDVQVEDLKKSDTVKDGEEVPQTSTDEKIKAEQEEEQEDEEVIVPKPPMDLFKAIFADSSESESEKEEEKEENAAETAARLRQNHASAEKIKGPANPWEERRGNVLRSKEPAKGIFANIDFEALNKRTSSKRPRSPSNSPPRESKEFANISKDDCSSSSSDDGFGPALPPGLKQDVKVEKEVTNITLSSDSDEYKEKKSKKRKKDKKKKHKEHKKHKESKKRKSSNGPVIVLSDSDEDGLMSILKTETSWSEKKKKSKKKKSR